MKFWIAFIVAMLALGPGRSFAAPNYPLVLDGDGRHIVDSGGQAVFFNADSPWHVIPRLTREETITFLDSRRENGFNALLVALIVADGYSTGSSNNAYGQGPFLTPGDFATPNEAYFSHADWFLEQARARGFTIFLTPAYIAYCDGTQGWCNEMEDNGVTKMREYGRWLGNRYKDQPNLIWVHGGDASAGTRIDLVDAIAYGILDFDSNHLSTAHCNRYNSAADCYDRPWLDFNTTYANCNESPLELRVDYQRLPSRPFVFIEGRYELEWDWTAQCIRGQAYSALLGGAVGQFYGNGSVWDYTSGWEAQLTSTGAQDMDRFSKLVHSRRWDLLAPDYAHTVLTSGYGDINNSSYAAAAQTTDGNTIVVYAPSQRTLRINLDVLSGSNATAWWFNPRDGSVDGGTPLTSSGARDFTTPTNADWVLVIDNGDAMLPPPGTAILVPDPPDPPDPPAPPDPPDPDRLAWYSFATEGGGFITDLSGNRNDASCTPGSTCPVFVSGDGQPPGSYDFTGNGNYIELPNESAFDFTTALSVSLWMKSATATNTWAQLVGKGDSAWGVERYRSTNSVSFTTFALSSDNMVGSTNVFDGQWHHIAAVYDGSQKTLYVDGAVDAQKPYSATLNTNDFDVRLGYNSEYPTGQYDGLLDDVRIYRDALTPAEVQALMAPAGNDCRASAPGRRPSTPWYLVVLGAWALIERRRLRAVRGSNR